MPQRPRHWDGPRLTCGDVTRTQPVQRLDLAGAAWLIGDSEIAAIGSNTIALRNARSSSPTDHLSTPLGSWRAGLSRVGARALIDHLEHPDKFGPWRERLDETERKCRWRAFAALALVFAGPDSILAVAAREAETLPAAADAAWNALLTLPPLQRRRLLTISGAMNALG
jgi:hypothetical protein